MSHLVSTDVLLSHPRVVGFLIWPCDFEPCTPSPSDGWFTIEPGNPYRLIAKDGTGGLFGLSRTAPPEAAQLFHVTSEGQASFIAANLTEGIQLMIAHPYWRDLLKFSGGGKLPEMMRAIPYLEAELQKDEPTIDNDRVTIYRLLGLDRPQDPVSKLHATVIETSRRFTFVSKEGWKLESLFNRFVVDVNPMWRKRNDA